jgi:hypothetical protein
MMAPGDHLIVFPTRTPLSETAGSIRIPCCAIQRTVSNERPIRISDSSGSLRPSVTRSRSARKRFVGYGSTPAGKSGAWDRASPTSGNRSSGLS